MSKLRVAFVAPSLEILGGQAVQADRLLRAWRDDPDVEAYLVPVNPVPPRVLRFARRIKYLRTIVNELTYGPLLFRELARSDVVHVFSASYSSFLLAPLPALLVARLLLKPILLNYRSGQADDHLRRSPLARRALAGVDCNAVPSGYLVEVFRTFGIDARIVPNLIDLDRFRYRERVPLTPRLLSTRNFDDLYNVAATLRAFRLVQDRWPNATLTLVGSGRQERALRALASELRLEHVTFAGRVNPADIHRYYESHDIYVQTPNVDNMPTSVLEAFASGLPVVSTNVGGVPTIVTDGQHGLLAELDDHRTIAAHLLHLLDTPDHARALARAAYATCRACTWPAVREQWLDAYRAAIAANEPRRETDRKTVSAT
jgi:glycosyltransferase involved in cell wall biosynthesis